MALGWVRISVVLAIGVGLASIAPSVHADVSDICRKLDFEGARFTACRYDPARNGLRLYLNGRGGPLGGFADLDAHLGGSRRHLDFAMNAGMFDARQRPVGLLVMSGRVEHAADVGEGAGNFYLKPNGVFWVGEDGQAHVQETDRYLAHRVQAQWATQSGPLLLQEGRLHPKIGENGASHTLRNGVCTVGAGSAWFVISDEPVSFGRFARLMRDRLECADGLYFDGSVSALWAPSLKRRDPATGLGPLVAVFEKP